MLFKELQERFSIITCTEQSFKNNFKRYQDKILEQYNVHLEKMGRGTDCRYYIREEEYFLQNSSFDDTNTSEGQLVGGEFYLTDNEFFCLLVILFSPMGVFRGTYQTFAKYAEIEYSTELEDSIRGLSAKGYIDMIFDTSTNEGYFILTMKRFLEREYCYKIDVNMVRQCIAIAKKNNKRTWIPLFKLWTGISAFSDKIMTVSELAENVGLTEYQVRKYGKILRDEGAVINKPIYIGEGSDDIKCIGTKRTPVADWSWNQTELETALPASEENQ